MNLLFLTTLDVSIEREHVFTLGVWNELSKKKSISLASVLFSNEVENNRILKKQNNNRDYYILEISYYKRFDYYYIVNCIIELYKISGAEVIHSNMIEGFDIEAAKVLGISIFLTIHIGGFICPRGGGNGFLKYDDTICNVPIGKQCMLCGCKDLPLSNISYLILKYTPKRVIKWLSCKLKNKNVFYITPLLYKYVNILNRKKYIELLKYSKIIAANKKLEELLILNGIPKENIILLPHGVKEREHLSMPKYNGKIIFYYLGRIQYSKGLHILMKALKGIDNNKYELHIIGDAEKYRKELRYENYIKKLSKNKSVIFHGRLPNDKIENIIKDCHVMIHPAIFLEIYGISIAESLSLGRPVLATKCGGAEMQIKDNYNGWLVAPNSVIEMKNKIDYIINNPSEVYKLHLNSKNPCIIENYVFKLIDCYEYEFTNLSPK